jgi:glycosyltransferase involved in cell wall biosynthesis
MLNFDHTPTYTWPNPAFPFRQYLIHDNLRIFIIENIHHNWKWLKEASRRFQARDFFLVYCGWECDDWFLSQDLAVFSALDLDKKKFFFLFNTAEEMNRYTSAGFVGELINQNCWLPWDLSMRHIPEMTKKYDAVYVGRFTPFKRHWLANNVNSLALVIGDLMGAEEAQGLPPHTYRNEVPLDEDGVAKIINESKCGLILSETEGACFASSEYLLCGIPVVSTRSKGGRDIWYNDYNSIQVEENPASVAEAVEYFVKNPRDPNKIRNDHIKKSLEFRETFIRVLKNLFHENCVELDPLDFFNTTYMNKLRTSETPVFQQIWPY